MLTGDEPTDDPAASWLRGRRLWWGVPVRIDLLGPLAVQDEAGAVLSPGGPKQRAALALLALNVGRVVSLDALVDGIWGDDPPESALNSLQVYVHGLRKALGSADVIVRQDPGYRLNASVATDVGRAEDLRDQARAARDAGDLAATAEAYERLEGLWRGDPLADLATMPFATYVAVQLLEAHLADLEAATEVALELGRHREVLPRLEQLVATYPMREAFWAQLMLALYRSDRQGDALTAFRRAREALADELGVDPGPTLRELESAVLRQESWLDAPAVSDTPAATSAPLEHDVPRPPHAVIGRDGVIAEVVESLRGGARLVSLIGTGGIGKTRTAVAVAHELLDEFDTVRVVDLASATNADDLLRDLASSFGVPPDDSDMATIAGMLAGRRTLLVLDNLEQVAGAGMAVAALLADLSELSLVVTSRRPLRISAERLVQLEPLDADAGRQLFEDRAALLRADFRVDDSNRADVDELCRRLDGLPLALEIAAARVRLLTPHDMLARLDAGLEKLGAGQADLPDRQRTLTATVAWSLDLLEPAARDLCARLAIFDGGFTAAAAVSVCGTDDPDAVLDGIEALIDASLVVPMGGVGQARFRQFGTVREHARSLLSDTDSDRLRTAHATYFVGHAAELATGLDGPEHERAMDELEREGPDVLAAIDALAAAGALAEVSGVIGALTPWWVASGRLNDGLALVETALALPGAETDPTLLTSRGILTYHLTDWPAATERLRVALSHVGPGTIEAARIECHLGAALLVTGEPEAGAAHAAAALEQAVAEGWDDVHVLALSALAIAAAIGGNFATERSRYHERLALVRARGDRARTVDTLSTLAEIDVDEGDWDSARDHAAEALSLVGSSMTAERRDTLVVLARIALAQDDVAAARSHLADALETSVGLGQPLGLAQVLRTASGLAAASGRHAEGARLVGASEALRESLVISDDVEVDLAGFADAVKEALPDARYDEEVATGRSLARADVLALAEGLVSGSSSAS